MARWREVEAEPESLSTASPPGQPPPLSEQRRPVRARPVRGRKSWRRRVLGHFAWAATVSLVIMCAHFFSGPTADVPALDPAEKINREADGLPTNAAPLYRHVIEAYEADDKIDWDDLDRIDEPEVRARFNAHLARNAECIRCVEEATHLSPCLFRVERDRRGFVEPPDVLVLRDVSGLLRARLICAAADHDLSLLNRTLVELDQMGRHLTSQRTPIAYLIGLGSLGAVQERLLDPFDWPGLSEADRKAYGEQIAALCAPPPDLTEVLRFTRDELCWAGRDGARPKRMAGEVDRYMAPLLRLADLPVEEQVRSDQPVRAEMTKLWAREAPSKDLLGSQARKIIPFLRVHVRALDLRARVVATQRGNLTAASILEAHAANGEWPADLAAFGPMAMDLYCGEPLVYAVRGESFVLYSRGVDADDDGGRHDARFGAPPPSKKSDQEPPPDPDGDYVFWPLSAQSSE